jgi:hypothetical protein
VCDKSRILRSTTNCDGLNGVDLFYKDSQIKTTVTTQNLVYYVIREMFPIVAIRTYITLEYVAFVIHIT